MAKTGFLNSIKRAWSPADDEFDYEETVVEEEAEPTTEKKTNYEDFQSESYETEQYEETRQDNVMNFSGSNSEVQVILFKPKEFEAEVGEIANELMAQHTVVINMEHTATEVRRRVLDFMMGVAYARNGKIYPLTENTYIVTPHNVQFDSPNDTTADNPMV